MIPPAKANHASFLEQLPGGTLALAWFSGTKEGADKCSIVLATLPTNSSQVSTQSDYSYSSSLQLMIKNKSRK